MELSFEEICVLVVKVLLLGVMNPLQQSGIKRSATKVINSKGHTILLVVGCFASSGGGMNQNTMNTLAVCRLSVRRKTEDRLALGTSEAERDCIGMRGKL
jgi:hypothetical protein